MKGLKWELFRLLAIIEEKASYVQCSKRGLSAHTAVGNGTVMNIRTCLFVLQAGLDFPPGSTKGEKVTKTNFNFFGKKNL